MSEIKLVVCDLDGTLLNDEKLISPYTVSVMSEVKKRGISICLASGRDEQMMSVYEKQLGGCDYMISDNGAVARGKKKQLLHCCFLDEKDVAELLGYLNSREMTFMMYCAEEMYYSESEKLKKRIHNYEALAEKAGSPIKLKAKKFLRDAPIRGYAATAKVVVYEDGGQTLEAYKQFIDSLSGVHYEPTGYGLLGAFHSQVSKKTALEKVMEDLDLSKDEVCVFGDYENDLSMFACAGRRVCMGNGVQALKDASTCITFSNNDDGVARFIEKELDIKANGS